MAASTSSVFPSATSSGPAPTSTGDERRNGPSSPLLFFVALGFGVVFTNLWIIVGVKYCFRYNQRNRQRMQGEDPDAVDLGQMPRQHRRRREKKLMTMDEVNEKFPLTKYKTWRSNRAEEGLPTAGGINATSRPASIRDVNRESTDVEPKSPSLIPPHIITTEEEKVSEPNHGKAEEIKEASSSDPEPQRPKTAQSTAQPSQQTPLQKVTSSEEGDDDDHDHIQTAVPAEQLPDPGDACAICIDTIEDDDDVRGLHCGHAFHASCVDPWLTSRRACCPLCKADYYVPKPRPEGADAEEARRRGRDNLPAPPQFAFMGGGRRPTMVLPGRFMSIVYDDRDRYGFPRVVREPRPPRTSRSLRRQQAREERQRQMSSATTVNGDGESQAVSQQSTQQPPPPSGWRSRLANVRIPNPMANFRARGNGLANAGNGNGNEMSGGVENTADERRLEEGRASIAATAAAANRT